MKYCDWQNPPEKLNLLKNEIHLWQANLDLPSIVIEKLARSLSEDERTRANRFHFAQHRDRFIAGRGILRQLLAKYLQVNSDRIRFEYSSRGKPYLASCLNQNNLQFNVSHSHNLALYGFNYQKIIGVDLEYIKDNINYKQLATRFFTTQELELISCTRTEAQKTRFFQLWTAKEAYLKATGDGLAQGLDGIEFTIDQNNKLSLVSIKQEPTQISDWLINNFIIQDKFIATIAVKDSLKSHNIISEKLFRYSFNELEIL